MARMQKPANGVAVDGAWFGVPAAFFASRACCELSPLACKMLLTLLGQLRSNHFGNGRISAHKDKLRACGWTSAASARAALGELQEAGLVVCTLAGRKGRTALYGVTLFPMHCEPKGLDVGPGAWRVTDWRNEPGSGDQPTEEKPAAWHRPRSAEKQKSSPRCGNESSECEPAAGMNPASSTPCNPAAGPHKPLKARNAFPLRVPPLREAICMHQRPGRMAVLMAAHQCPNRRPPAYIAARNHPALQPTRNHQ